MALARNEHELKEDLPPPALLEPERVADIRFLIQVSSELLQSLSNRKESTTLLLAMPACAATAMYLALLFDLVINTPTNFEYNLPKISFNSTFESLIAVAFIFTLMPWIFSGYLEPTYYFFKDKYKPTMVNDIYQSEIIQRINLKMGHDIDLRFHSLNNAITKIDEKVTNHIISINDSLQRPDVSSVIDKVTEKLSKQIDDRTGERKAADLIYSVSMGFVQFFGYLAKSLEVNEDDAWKKETVYLTGFLAMNLHALCSRTRRFYDRDSNIGKFDLQLMLADFQAIDYREATVADLESEQPALVQLKKFRVGLNRDNVNSLRFFKDPYVQIEEIDPSPPEYQAPHV